MDQLPSGIMRAHAIRLTPGQNLVPALEDAATRAMAASGASSSFVLSAVGSLDGVTLRMANASRKDDGEDKGNEIREWNERFEVVSLVGTFSPTGKHLHISVSDAKGQTFGGHLMSGRVFTTLELVLGTIDDVVFERKEDPETGYKELTVTQENTGKRKRNSEQPDISNIKE
jgi:predicted DNA-binding protein with PD1-like motif